MSEHNLKGYMADGIFNGFIASMMVMAVSTVFLFGVTFRTALCALCGAIALTGIIHQVLTTPKPVSTNKARTKINTVTTKSQTRTRIFKAYF